MTSVRIHKTVVVVVVVGVVVTVVVVIGVFPRIARKKCLVNILLRYK